MRTYNSMMKGIVSSILVLVFATFVAVSSTYAAAVTPKGNVQTSGGVNAVGASVTVTCNSFVENTTTDSNGNYSVTFPNGQCDSGDTVSVVVELNGETGSTSAPAGNGNLNMSTIVLAAIAVPEFGLITGLVAAAGSGLAYMKMRKGSN